MSLFAVERYLGDESEEDANKNQASDILEKLQKEAKARRKSLKKKNDTNDVNNVTTVTISEESENEHEEFHEQKKQKKKKKAKEKGKDKELENIFRNSIEENDDLNIVKKKKKKKRKHSDIGIANGSVGTDETEYDTPLKKGKLGEETEQFERETDKHVKHKKHKKQKHKHGSDLDEERDEIVNDMDIDVEKNVAENDIGEVDEKVDSEDEVDKDEVDKRPYVGTEKETEIGGFTVIGNVRPARLEKVKRVLPEWLSSPSIISSDLGSDKLPISDMPGLAPDLVEKLKENKITHFFPVQRHVIPALLESSITGFHIGRAGYRPSDICVSAPTGSGKTLAFVLPIIQGLRSRVTCEVRVLAVLPVRDLATQVFKVFQAYCEGTDLKVGLMIGQKTLLAEQQSLVKKRLRGYHSMVDIIVATPGRLVDHINQTEGFNLGHLRYLVIDEADRMMDEIKQDWLIQVENSVYRCRPRPGPLTASYCQRMEMPLQKLLYSATLSQNPEKLQMLSLFQPKLFTSVVKTGIKPIQSKTVNERQDSGDKLAKRSVDKESDNDADLESDSDTNNVDNKSDGNSDENSKIGEKPGDFVGKYATPSSLSEYYIETTSGEKPLIILHLLHHLKYRNILCFTNSVESTHRLFMLIKLYGGIEVKEFSSSIHVARRNAILKKFEAGKIDILVCSDAMARGMDITTVKYVISYDPPSYIQTYIHRIGRTARAGKEGSAFTLLQKKEFFHFKKMVREAGKGTLRPLKISKDDVKPLLPKYEETLK
ncbi:LOW QUALITY PROTEIN: ATP-dependent RNA helicase DDX51-like, partial [Ruditapes philippinarum]|uniref:LOW QUALITY PROTEIN: ATP-dependent RNA helicase DDX51-like n=1 Tax=Ruditapes philippinarum TaxID=129788 RepID=UPI00295BFC16